MFYGHTRSLLVQLSGSVTVPVLTESFNCSNNFYFGHTFLMFGLTSAKVGYYHYKNQSFPPYIYFSRFSFSVQSDAAALRSVVVSDAI